ncbi:hypothetical protein LOTGIDRAFT_176479 [Lottia gigantea]|nr:hypothetical protein LOTGIDRAFT_176479 [Lottia gigantea]ESP00298.1 hypothetical protein LOTGIDRAFT_176479 [Lottia gigantea]
MTKDDMSDMIGKITESVLHQIRKGITIEFQKIEDKLEDKLEKIASQNNVLIKENEQLKKQVSDLNFKLYDCNEGVKESLRISNYNEQYSRKTNLKFLNIKCGENMCLADKIIEIIKDVSNNEFKLNKSDIIAIHPLQSKYANKPKPIILKVKNTEIKENIMKYRKSFFNSDIPVYHDVTKKNMDLIKHLKTQSYIASAWYYNCHVYAKTDGRHKVKIDLFDDFESKIKHAPSD